MKYIDVKLYNSNKLINNYKNIPCIIKDERLIFTIDDKKTIFTPTTFEREDKESKFILNHQDRTCIYTLKTINQSYDIEVEKININRQDNQINIDYKISSNEEDIKVIIEIKE